MLKMSVPPLDFFFPREPGRGRNVQKAICRSDMWITSDGDSWENWGGHAKHQRLSLDSRLHYFHFDADAGAWAACLHLFCFLPNMAWSGAVQWRCRVLQSDDHRERWLITLVTMPVLWPWPLLLNYTGSVNVQVNGACLGDVWNKLLLAWKGSSASQHQS